MACALALSARFCVQIQHFVAPFLERDVCRVIQKSEPNDQPVVVLFSAVEDLQFSPPHSLRETDLAPQGRP